MSMLVKDTRSQDGIDDKDNDKGSKSRPQSMKEQVYNKEQRERPRPHELNDKSNLIDLMKEFSWFDSWFVIRSESVNRDPTEIHAYTQALKKVEAQLVAHQQGQLWYEEKIRFMKIDLDDKTDVLTYHKKLLAEAKKEKEDLKAKICDKKNKVLFTDSECLVLSPEFKLPDANQVLLRIPRQNNMYSFQFREHCDSEKEAESAQDYFVLPIWSSYSSTVKRSTTKDAGEAPNKHPDLKTDEKPVDKEDQVFLDELERLKRQEQDANDAAEALRKEFAQETEDLLLQAELLKLAVLT
ncbi:hypothetical protein Tco_1245293 [Tanacetum coccineum]